MPRYTLSSIFLVMITMASCVMSKTYTDEEKKMRYGPDQVFVIKTNGEKIVGKKVSEPRGFHAGAYWVKLDNQKFPLDEVQSYQDKHAFRVNFDGQWVKQLKRGKINLFYFETVTRVVGNSPSIPAQYESHQYFVFQKGDGPLQKLSLEGISQLLSDNRKAHDMFDAKLKPGRRWLPKQLDKHPKVLFECVDIYNNG